MESWRSRLIRGRIGQPLLSWLEEPGSLTARCQRASREFRIRLRRFECATPMGEEGVFVGLRPGQKSWVREVILECDGVPVIFAHTVLPRTPRGRLSRWLAGLGSRSLGSLLFAYPGFSRGRIEFLRLDRRHGLYRQAVAATGPAPDTLWARRSWHRLGAQRVLVTEVFLPPILALEK